MATSGSTVKAWILLRTGGNRRGETAAGRRNFVHFCLRAATHHHHIMNAPAPEGSSAGSEALGRAVIAEFEWRQQEQRREQRRRHWRWGYAFVCSVALMGAGAYVQVAHITISGAEAVGLFAVWAASMFWNDFANHDEIRKLRAEVQELKAAIGAQRSR